MWIVVLFLQVQDGTLVEDLSTSMSGLASKVSNFLGHDELISLRQA